MPFTNKNLVEQGIAACSTRGVILDDHIDAPWQIAGIAILALVFLGTPSAKGLIRTGPERVNFCDVVASPSDYDEKLLSVEVTVRPSFHSLSIYNSACAPKEGFDVTTQAILPDRWESLAQWEKVKTKHWARPAKVTLVGIFRSNVSRGQDGQRFTFAISKIISVSPG